MNMQSAILLTYLDPHFFEMPIIINIFILKFAQDSMAKSKIESCTQKNGDSFIHAGLYVHNNKGNIFGTFE